MIKIALLCENAKRAKEISMVISEEFDVFYIDSKCTSIDTDTSAAIVYIGDINTVDRFHVTLQFLVQQCPVLLIAKWTNFTEYLGALQTGVRAIISLPIASKQLASLLSLIIDVRFSGVQASEGGISFRYNENDYELPLSPDHMLTQLLVFSHRCISQNALVSQLLKNRQSNEMFFDDDSNGNKGDSLMEQSILDGLEKNEFVLHYQPVCRLSTMRPEGFEALIRWKRNGVFVNPDDFIPVAERTNAIFALSKWTFAEAMRQTRAFLDSFRNLDPFRISMNMSTRLFEDESIAEFIIDKQKEYGLAAENIGIEITESALLQSMERANIILLKLKAASIALYMDDFGTGYSSLTYLKHFPLDIIKIDKSFVKWLNVDEESGLIVQSILGLAHGLKLSVVGEGLEDAEQLQFLQLHDCEYGQGFYFAKPLTYPDALNFLQKYYKTK